MTAQEINLKMSELAEYTRINEEIMQHIDSLKDELKKHMIDNNLTELNGTEHKATYKNVTVTRVDTKALKKKYSDIVNEYTIVSTSSRFTFK